MLKRSRPKGPSRTAEETGLRSARKWRDLYDDVPDGFVSIDRQGRLLEMNRAFRDLTGYTAEELRRMTFRDLTPGKWLQREEEIIESQMKTGRSSSIYEKEYRRKDGTVVPVELHTFPSREGKGAREWMWAIVRDISERKRAEEEARESRKQAAFLFASSLDAILLTAPDGSIFDANPAACEMFGRTAEELRSVGRAGVVDMSDPRVAAALEERARTGRFRGELNFLRRDGSKFPGEISTWVYWDSEGREKTSMIIRDVSARKRNEEARRLSEEKFSKVFAVNPIALSLTSIRDGTLFDINEGFVRTTGFSREEAVGRSAAELGLYPDATDRTRFLSSLKEAGLIQDVPIRIRRKSGEVRDMLLSGTTLVLGGEPYYLISGTDITERQRAEEALRLSEEKFAKTFAGSPISMSLTSVEDAKIADVNEAFVRNSGYAREELLGRTPGEMGFYVSPEDRERLIAGSLSQGPAFSLETMFRVKSGELIDCLVSVARVVVGGKDYFLSSILNITERRRMETALQEREAFIQAILDSLPVGVAVHSTKPGAAFYYMNDNFPRFYRTTREKIESVDRFWEAVYEDPEARERLKKRVSEDIASGDPGRMLWADIPIARAGEETRFITSWNVPVPGRPQMISLVLDVTDRIRNEATLKKRLRYEETLSSISSLAASVADLDGFLNEVLRRLGTALDISRVYIFEYRLETGTGDNTFEWTAPGMEAMKARLQGLSVAEFAWLAERLRGNRVVSCSDLAEIPDEKTREILALGGTRSVLIVPLFVNDELFGLIGFDECRVRREWPQEDVDLLRAISRTITGAIERRLAEERLAEQLDELRRWQTVTLGRETRILGLKYEVNELLARSGLPPRYENPAEEK
ncbi:MAG TPA: PAS domain S-box protein [Candidatus Aminicenantes bacterium]|nr:PAS domain S-box protein [Candidatus Aminicenantes bacterium]HRY65419.1 PAS domain S-box protein [Candidatus Aminicenantes bacterium]HRZ72113.1 PAS domain S-box protein [Candidatus Aminicenantes bacterium]